MLNLNVRPVHLEAVFVQLKQSKLNDDKAQGVESSCLHVGKATNGGLLLRHKAVFKAISPCSWHRKSPGVFQVILDYSTVRHQVMQPMVRVFHLCIEDSAQLTIACWTDVAVQTSQGAGSIVSGSVGNAQCSFLHAHQVLGELYCEREVPDLTCMFQNGADDGFVDSDQVCRTHTTLLQLTQHKYPLVSLANNVYNVSVPLQTFKISTIDYLSSCYVAPSGGI